MTVKPAHPAKTSQPRALQAAWIGLDRGLFDRLSRIYRDRWGLWLLATDARGRRVFGPEAQDKPADRQRRRFIVEQTLRWGEPTLVPDDHTELVWWAVPLMHNAELLGGLLAHAPERWLADDEPINLHRACAQLRELAEMHNLTNAAFLEARRREYRREQRRAEAIEAYKSASLSNIRTLFLVDEPEMVAAIRRGDQGQARAVLNRVLAAMYHYAGQNFELIKSFCMELVVTLSRSAVEAGGRPEELLGNNYANIAALSRMTNEEELAPWLHQMLERIISAIKHGRAAPTGLVLTRARDYVAAHLDRQISRDDVARAVHLSPAHFSRLFRRESGQTFTEFVNRRRVDRAAELLARSGRDLAEIALDCGFRDQSYFTKIFRRHTGMTPRRYRVLHSRNQPAGADDRA